MYSHDGIRDSLTQLAAPTLLYEELRREIARAKRESQPISLVRFVLASNDHCNHEMNDSAISSYESEVIRFAHILTRFSRDEDVCARMGEWEFVCILHGREDASSIYMSRIMVAWSGESSSGGRLAGSPSLRLGMASLVCIPGENALGFLNRLDLEILTPCE